MLNLIEKEDGYLVDEAGHLVKVRTLSMLPAVLQEACNSKEEVKRNSIEEGADYTIFQLEGRHACVPNEQYALIKYLIGAKYFLSIPEVPHEKGSYYFVICYYKYGIVIIAPIIS